MNTSPHRRLPFLLALIVAIAEMPTNVYQVCAWNIGTLDIEPWHRKAFSGVARAGRSLMAIMRAWFGASGAVTGLPALAGALLLILAIAHVAHAAPHGQQLAIVAVAGLKAATQRDAELKAELAKAKKDKAAIGEKALGEKRAMTDEERTQFLGFTPKIEQLEAQLAENGEILASMQAARDVELQSSPVADADADAAAQADRTSKPRAVTVEERVQKSPSFMGHALHAVRRIALREEQADDRKLVRMMAGPTGASSDVPSDGGFLIAPEQSGTIIQRSYDVGEIARLVTRQPVSGNQLNLPAVDETSRANGSRFGGVSSTWIGQGTSVTAGKPKFRLMELKLKKLLAFVYGTDELIADAAAFAAFVNRNLPQELNFATEDAIVNGDGSNKPQGILNSAGLVNISRNTASRVLYEDVSAMWKRMWAPLRKSAIWMIDQSVEQELEQVSIAIGTAGVLAPIYKPAGVSVGPDGTQGYSPATLYGRPILTTEYNAALGTVGDIVLWAPGEYVLIDKAGVESAVSLHVAFLTDEAVWRFTYRADGQLSWNAPLTPKNGGATLAPVVTLT